MIKCSLDIHGIDNINSYLDRKEMETANVLGKDVKKYYIPKNN